MSNRIKLIYKLYIKLNLILIISKVSIYVCPQIVAILKIQKLKFAAKMYRMVKKCRCVLKNVHNVSKMKMRVEKCT